MTDKPTATWTEATIATLLTSNPRAVRRAVLAIDARQTAVERACYQTSEANGRGWSQFDARFGGWLAAEIRAGRPLHTEKLRACALKLALRYRRQLAEEANRREANGTAEVGRVMATARKLGADVPASPAEARAYAATILASLRDDGGENA